MDLPMINEESEICEGIVLLEELIKQYWKNRIKLVQQRCPTMLLSLATMFWQRKNEGNIEWNIAEEQCCLVWPRLKDFGLVGHKLPKSPCLYKIFYQNATINKKVTLYNFLCLLYTYSQAKRASQWWASQWFKWWELGQTVGNMHHQSVHQKILLLSVAKQNR